MTTTIRPTSDSLERLRGYLADGFGFEPSAPTRGDDDITVVTALALCSIAESLAELAARR